MRAYVIRRILLIIPTLFLVTLLVFLTIRLIPGSAIDQMLAGRALQEAETGASHEDNVEALRRKLGLDVPIHVQYARWLGDAFRGDLGESVWTGIPVMEQIAITSQYDIKARKQQARALAGMETGAKERRKKADAA